ncbi:hypothetical protein EVAR_25122_1 [Eumeta japonica]|uniref:Uncharacterized protein n=1 Tax=Eumeta variegata TaxID=151549 RepID=A0A4C1XJM1_EUMVA|nr:hypothetical protein EVAR_25122_1 [Eumeta japonica]
MLFNITDARAQFAKVRCELRFGRCHWAKRRGAYGNGTGNANNKNGLQYVENEIHHDHDENTQTRGLLVEKIGQARIRLAN